MFPFEQHLSITPPALTVSSHCDRVSRHFHYGQSLDVEGDVVPSHRVRHLVYALSKRTRRTDKRSCKIMILGHPIAYKAFSTLTSKIEVCSQKMGTLMRKLKKKQKE